MYFYFIFFADRSLAGCSKKSSFYESLKKGPPQVPLLSISIITQKALIQSIWKQFQNRRYNMYIIHIYLHIDHMYICVYIYNCVYIYIRMYMAKWCEIIPIKGGPMILKPRRLDRRTFPQSPFWHWKCLGCLDPLSFTYAFLYFFRCEILHQLVTIWKIVR
jgi:hypothetical protein